MTVNRRALVSAAAAAALLPGVVLGNQASRIYRLAVLLPGPVQGMTRYHAAALERLAQHGFVAGRNLVLEIRPTSYNRPHDIEQVRALLANRPDALLTYGTFITRMAQELTAETPIVFTFVGDAVAYGVLKSEGRPGGNVTGVSMSGLVVNRKRLDLLRELLPHARRVAVVAVFGGRDIMFDANQPVLRASATRLGLELIEEIGWSGYGGFVPAIDAAAKRGAEGLLVLSSQAGMGFCCGGQDIVQATIAHRLPAIFLETEVVEMGGLISYGVRLEDEARRAADMLAKVFAGAKAGDLPVDQASRFELAVNAKTARTIGIEIPQSILLRADRVVE
jgi:putative ABC transport system substrate-binding protein